MNKLCSLPANSSHVGWIQTKHVMHCAAKRIHSDDFRGHGGLGCIDQALSAQVICPDSEILINVANCLPEDENASLHVKKKLKSQALKHSELISIQL